jgi:hypothetical protein
VTVRPAHFTLALCALLLGACAALPDDSPVVEQLDEQTGNTVARLGKPIELYRENFREDATGERFAFLGPFETNEMGNRVPYLLIGLPEERDAAPAAPVLMIDGDTVEIGAPARDPEFAGLRESPYKIPTPWVQIYYFRVDAALIRRLGAADKLRLEVVEQTRSEPRKIEYTADVGGDPRLRDFASR